MSKWLNEIPRRMTPNWSEERTTRRDFIECGIRREAQTGNGKAVRDTEAARTELYAKTADKLKNDH